MLNVCIIDDDIPVNGRIQIDDTQIINQNLLDLLVAENSWNDSNVFNLLKQVLEQRQDWIASAFTVPEHYLSAWQVGLVNPDIIVFDWEYSKRSSSFPEIGTVLLEILEQSFALVYIYTGGDHEEQVQQRVAVNDLHPYMGKRLQLLMKDNNNSCEQLLQEARALYDRNFSFRFGSQLRKAAREGVEKILVMLGAYEIDFIKKFLSDEGTKETDIKILLVEKIAAHILGDETLLAELMTRGALERDKAVNLLEIIKAKFRDEISSKDIGFFDEVAESLPGIDKLSLLWSYRLYYEPSDSLVRRGDIVTNSGGEYYLVVTPDCNLAMFWHKNYGYINLIPLWDINTQASRIKDMLSITRNDADVKKAFNKQVAWSVAEKLSNHPDGSFVLPYIKSGDVHLFLMGFSRAIKSILIDPKPLADGQEAKSRSQHSLEYTHWRAFKRIACISEPFLTPILHNALIAISGIGAPNFCQVIRNNINEEIKKACDSLWPTV